MQNIWIIAKREYKQLFSSPIAYVFLLITLITLGLFFYLDMVYSISSQQYGQNYVPSIQQTLSLFVFPILFLAIPAITMKTVADEHRSGTLELLLTAPVRDWELVTGKWLGCVLFFFTAALITWIYPIVLNSLVQPGIDQGVVITGYLGLALLICAMCAIGVLLSSLFNNQIAALFATIGTFIILWVISSPAQVSPGGFTDVLKYLCLPEHFYNSFLTGIIQINDVVYYVSMTAAALFLGSTVVEMKRWR